MKLLIAEAFELIRNGASIKQDKASGGIPITRIETIANGSIDYNRLGYAGIDNDLYKDYYLQVGDILMSHINSEEHLGKVAIYNGSMKIIHGMNLLCLRPNKNIINPFYAFFFFKSKQFRTRIQRITKKSVNQASFNITSFEKLSISLPNLNAQNDIAQTLLQTETLIKQRKESIALLDEFLRSTFLKMFGDPVKNEKGWEKRPLQSLVSEDCPLTYGIVQPGNEEQNGVPIVRPVDLTTDYIQSNGLKKIKAEISQQFKRTILKGGEILFCVRGTTGVVAFATDELAGCNVSRGITPIWFTESFDKKFAFHLFRSTAIQTIIQRLTYGATLKQINLNDLRLLELISPPEHLQKQFSFIAIKAEVIKAQFQESLKELENLYGSLSQRFFRPSQEAEDKRYGDPFEVDEETAMAQGKVFYKEWKRLRDNRIMEKNLDKALEYAIHPERIPKAVAGEKINWESSDLEHFEYSGPLKEKGFGELANEALEELLNKHPNGFSFTEFRTYLKGSKNLDNYQQTKEFVFDLLEKGTLIQHFATPNYMRAAENPLFNPPGGDNLRDALIWLIPVKPAVQK